jgi:hypothetical protein
MRFDDNEARLPVTRLHRLEVMNALQLQVFQSRQPHSTRVSRELASAAQASFADDCSKQSAIYQCRLHDPSVDRQFEDLVLRHTATRGFRTYDLLHVSQALVLGCDTFWSSDEKANTLAALEGLEIRKAT